MEHSFAPIEDENSRILILGSLPGVRSLSENQYYAHPQNKFWKIIFGVFGAAPTDDYDAKISLLHKNHIALWDVVKCAERKGSSDGMIKHQKPNDIPAFLKKHKKIELIIFNGGFAFANYKKYFGEPQLPYVRMLSTSPACAGRDEARLRMWQEALAAAGN